MIAIRESKIFLKCAVPKLFEGSGFVGSLFDSTAVFETLRNVNPLEGLLFS